MVWFSYGYSLCFPIFFRLDRHASMVVPGFPMFSASPRYQPGMQLHKRSGANFSGDTRSETPLAMSKPETEGCRRLRSPKGRDMEGFQWENIGKTMGKSTWNVLIARKMTGKWWETYRNTMGQYGKITSKWMLIAGKNIEFLVIFQPRPWFLAEVYRNPRWSYQQRGFLQILAPTLGRYCTTQYNHS